MIDPRQYQFLDDGRFLKRGTLAQRLDTRTFATGEPLPANLPFTINPLRFLFQHVCGSNAVLIPIKQQDCPVSGRYFYLLSWLRRITSPEHHILLYLEANPVTVIMSVTVSDSVNTLRCINASATVPTVNPLEPNLFYVDNQCYVEN